jgi:hypothetical protein
LSFTNFSAILSDLIFCMVIHLRVSIRPSSQDVYVIISVPDDLRHLDNIGLYGVFTSYALAMSVVSHINTGNTGVSRAYVKKSA